MAKQQATPAKPASIIAKFQATAVGTNEVGERVHLITKDAPDASGNNDNTIVAGAQITVTAESDMGFFQAGAEYMVEFTPVVPK